MKQQNEMSARALAMEELENVNGGRGAMFQGGYFKSIKETIEKVKNIIDIDKKRYRVIA